jgi:hypothetical protein
VPFGHNVAFLPVGQVAAGRPDVMDQLSTMRLASATILDLNHPQSRLILVDSNQLVNSTFRARFLVFC